MGSLAKHIQPDDPKVAQVVTRLMDALGTPSEMVQRTIAQSLASLVPKDAVRPKAPELLASYVDNCCDLALLEPADEWHTMATSLRAQQAAA